MQHKYYINNFQYLGNSNNKNLYMFNANTFLKEFLI